MAQVQDIEGTWDELGLHAEDFRGRKLRLTVLCENDAGHEPSPDHHALAELLCACVRSANAVEQTNSECGDTNAATPFDALDMSAIARTLMPHLVQCRRCRDRSRNAFALGGASQDDAIAHLLSDADQGARWQDAASTAAAAAKRALLDQGIGYVYGRDGSVYKRRPDGQVESVPTPMSSEQ